MLFVPTLNPTFCLCLYIYIKKAIAACTHTQTNVDVNGEATFWAPVLSDTAVAENECLVFEKCQKNVSFSLYGGSLQCVYIIYFKSLIKAHSCI